MADTKAQKNAQKKAQKKADKKPSRSLVGRAGAAARKVVGRGRSSSTSTASAPEQAAKQAAKKPATKKAATKKPAKKVATQKAAAQKTAAKSTGQKPAAKKTAAKKAPAKKTTAKKAPAKTGTATKAAPAAKAVTTKKAAPRKTATKKSTTKKSAAKKSAAKKSTARSGSPAALVVLEQEDPWTKEELAEVRGQLRADIKRLTGELAEAQGDLSVLMRDAGEDAGSDQADIGSATFERDQEMTIVNNARDMLSQSERALERIAEGTYGVCESCGNPIGKNRLMVFPRATLCMTCKQREERR